MVLINTSKLPWNLWQLPWLWYCKPVDQLQHTVWLNKLFLVVKYLIASFCHKEFNLMIGSVKIRDYFYPWHLITHTILIPQVAHGGFMHVCILKFWLQTKGFYSKSHTVNYSLTACGLNYFLNQSIFTFINKLFV